MIKNFVILFGLLGPMVLFAFQNCSMVAFETATGDKSLVKALDEEDLLDQDPEVDLPLPEDVAEELKRERRQHQGQDSDENKSCADRKPPVDPDSLIGQAVFSQGNKKGICLIQAYSQIIMLKIKDNQLSDLGPLSPRRACVTAHACLNLVSQKFDVIGFNAVPGLCSRSNSTILSDSEVVQLVDAYNP